jgi:hypothetical protein
MSLGRSKKTRNDWKRFSKCQLLACADDVTALCENVNTVKKSVEALLEDGKEVSAEVSMLCHQNAEQYHYFCK